MPYPTCRHIKEDGHLCQSPALHRQHYCYFHGNHRALRMRMAQARARGERICIDLPPLEDMPAVQAALSQVTSAIAAGAIDRRDARLLLTALRLAANNFKTVQAWMGGSRFEVDEWQESVAGYPDLAAKYGLPPDTDLDADPESVFPPPQAKPGKPPLPPRVGHKRSAVGCRTASGILDDCKRLTPEDQLIVLQEIRSALAEGLGRKKPPTSAISAETGKSAEVAGCSG